jgi:hypothetical protein
MTTLGVKCPDDGAWLAVIPTPTGTSYLCGTCGRAFEASARDGSLLPDPEYRSLPKWIIGLVRDVSASSTGAVDTTSKLAEDLAGLSQRVDGDMRAAISRAADDAETAARHARDVSKGVNLIWGRVTEMQKSVDTVADLKNEVSNLRLDVAELRRQLREHVDHH